MGLKEAEGCRRRVKVETLPEENLSSAGYFGAGQQRIMKLLTFGRLGHKLNKKAFGCGGDFNGNLFESGKQWLPGNPAV
nr:hypothetical protein [uncultured Acetatifactor sp.]